MINSMTAKCLGPLAVKQAQIISSPPPCLTVGMSFGVCGDLLCLVFSGTVHSCQTSLLRCSPWVFLEFL